MSTGHDTNKIGDDAEDVVRMRLKALGCPFRVVHLGEKFPILDLYVEFDEDGETYPFFVQVKGTETGIEGSGPDRKLGVQLKKEKNELLARRRGPTYLIGVDLAGGALSTDEKVAKAFVRVVRGPVEEGFSFIKATEDHELNATNIRKLADEVKAYWQSTPEQKNTYISSFEP